MCGLRVRGGISYEPQIEVITSSENKQQLSEKIDWNRMVLSCTVHYHIEQLSMWHALWLATPLTSSSRLGTLLSSIDEGLRFTKHVPLQMQPDVNSVAQLTYLLL